MSHHKTLIAAAVAMAIGSTSAFAAQSIVKGTVGGTYFTPPVFSDTKTGTTGTMASGTAVSGTASSTAASVYAGAKVCFDLNDNGVCDAGEPFTTTDGSGNFQLTNRTGVAPLVAEISTSALNVAGGSNHAVINRNVFRVKADQVQAATASPALPALVDITPLTTEVARIVENNEAASFAAAVNVLASRLTMTPADVLKAPVKVTDPTELPALLQESVVDTGRFELAAKFVDRGDNVGELRGNFDCPSASINAALMAADAALPKGETTTDGTTLYNPANACADGDTNTVTIKQAQQFAQNLEGIPRYDNVFIIIMENQSLSSLVGASQLPYMNKFLNDGTWFYNYFSTGAPSEPNYDALGGADDWGATSDGEYPITGLKPNLATALQSHGLKWRVYEESMVPGQSVDVDNPTFNNGGCSLTSSLRARKHHPFYYYQSARNSSEFFSSDRSFTAAGTDVNGNAIPYTGAGTTALTTPTTGTCTAQLQAYATNNNYTSWWTNNTQVWNVDQLKSDLYSGDVGAYNFIVPDQIDDMHNPGLTTGGDYTVQNLVNKIKSSTLWQNPNRRVAIVVTFDEGESGTAPKACCGWNAGGGTAVSLSQPNANGTGTTSGQGSTNSYNGGNKGHGVTFFGVINNHQDASVVANVAPHGNKDTDYYSHFSFVRTLQDAFGLSDPGVAASYMSRSRYTEAYINQNPTLLPEYAGSANPHFDAVRAMNHVYQFPAGNARRVGGGSVTQPPAGPDPTQINGWQLAPASN